jgi:16S rRNA processing protein RimM
VDKAQKPPDPDFMLIGLIVGTFGWRGEIKVRPETDFPERFLELKEVLIEHPAGPRRLCHVETVRVTERQIRLKLAEFNNKEEAASLRESFILIPKSQAVPLPEGHFYLHQIVGLSVQTVEGKDLGKVVEVIRAPGNDVYVTPLVDIPARKEIVKEINLERGIIIVDMTLSVER